MNKEHFLIELKICLKAIAPQDQAIILEKYAIIFDERTAAGETEEQIAKSLGKPREIAEEILKEYDIEIPEQQRENDGWQEIEPDNSGMNYDSYYENFETPYDENTQMRYRPQHSPLARFFQVSGIVCLNLFLMIWIIFGIFMAFVGFWIAGVATILSPILGIYGVLMNYNNASLFQLSVSVFLFGASIIGWLLLVPLTKFVARIFRQYFQWNIAVLRGDI